MGCDGVVYAPDTLAIVHEMKIGSGTADTPQSECLALRLDALPAGSGAAVFGNLRMRISPVVKELVRGQW